MLSLVPIITEVAIWMLVETARGANWGNALVKALDPGIPDASAGWCMVKKEEPSGGGE